MHIVIKWHDIHDFKMSQLESIDSAVYDPCHIQISPQNSTKFANIIVWRYRYRLYRTDQHRSGTENYRYSNGQRLGVYWFIRGDKRIYIQERWIVSIGRLTVRVAGMLG